MMALRDLHSGSVERSIYYSFFLGPIHLSYIKLLYNKAQSIHSANHKLIDTIKEYQMLSYAIAYSWLNYE